MGKHDGKWYLTRVKKACRAYNMIEQGDRIAVGVSGGKDSSLLLHVMEALQRHLPVRFEVLPIHVALGFDTDMAPVDAMCAQLGYALSSVDTDIRTVVFDVRKEKNPCSLCAKMRKGALVNRAKELGCNKVALGHHLDDAVETFFLNLLYTGKLGAFGPVQYLDRRDITLIRPLIYLDERTTASVVRAKGLPVVPSGCPEDGRTRRDEMKELVRDLSQRYPDLLEKCRSALENVDVGGIWQNSLHMDQGEGKDQG